MATIENSFLAAFEPGDRALLDPHLKSVPLEQRKVLLEPGVPVKHVYFPTGAILSLVIDLSTGEMVETAMVGRDGMVGAAAALDSRISSIRAIVQLAGSALMCSADGLKAAVSQSPTLLSLIFRHEQALFAQVQQSVGCLAAHHVEARLCRWLLRARDLSGSDTMNFTQEFLGEMLGVQRGSVTVVAHTLQQAGMIRYSRGRIQITNVDGLQETACECYEATRSQSEALLRPKQ